MNKYKHLAIKQPKVYDSKDKTYRNLLLNCNETVCKPQGSVIIWHRRRYKLLVDTKFVAGHTIIAKCKMI